VSGGDIWTVPAGGGAASLLVTDPATERRPMWSPDGAELAFTSTRNGAANLYVLNLASGQLRRITYSDSAEQLDGWSRDGRWLYFSSGANDVAGNKDVYRVASSGGTPLEVSRERYLGEFNSAPSPDGKSVALMAKGMSSEQWWRNGHSHIDEAELWLKPVAAGEPYRKLLGASSKRLWPMWAADGRSLYFMSDEGGAENLWRMQLSEGAKAEALTKFTNGRVLFPSIAYDGKAIVFEREFAIWKLDTATGQAAEVPITLRGSPAGAGERRVTENNFRTMAVSPDGKKVAVIARGDVFASSIADGGAAQRITETPGAEAALAWSPDSRKLVYTAERGLNRQVMEYDFSKQSERAVTQATDVDSTPIFSPDGKMLAYYHGPRELHVITLATSSAAAQDKVLFTGALDAGEFSSFAWSPDSKWLAFPVTDRKSFTNVWAAPATGGEARPVSFLANGNTADQIAWSADGKYIVFNTSQRSEDAHLVRVDLLPHTPKYREDAFRDLFTAPASPGAPASKPDVKAPPGKPGPTPAAKPEPAATPSARPRRQRPRDQPGRQDAGVPRRLRQPAEPLQLQPRRTRQRSAVAATDFLRPPRQDGLFVRRGFEDAVLPRRRQGDVEPDREPAAQGHRCFRRPCGEVRHRQAGRVRRSMGHAGPLILRCDLPWS
jgi:Tol biopolymer transport system component